MTEGGRVPCTIRLSLVTTQEQTRTVQAAEAQALFSEELGTSS